jgi:predicted  nucleic acid-binding Zn-ribbon protein
LKDQLQLILALQTADARVKELQSQISKLPERLEPGRRDLAKLEAMVAAEKSRIDESVQWKKNQETLLEREQEGLRAARTKLNAVKNTKEYNAASREVDNRRKGIMDREAELKKVGEAMTSSVSGADAHAKDVEALRATLAVEEEKVAGQVAALQVEATEAIAVRDAARAKIEKGWLKTYDSLSTKKGYAVAPVVKGTCQGCHMTLPPQLNNILARLESIEMCPRCGRMIYRQELLEPAPGDKPA